MQNSAYTIRSALISEVGEVQKCVVWDAALDQPERRVQQLQWLVVASLCCSLAAH